MASKKKPPRRIMSGTSRNFFSLKARQINTFLPLPQKTPVGVLYFGTPAAGVALASDQHSYKLPSLPYIHCEIG